MKILKNSLLSVILLGLTNPIATVAKSASSESCLGDMSSPPYVAPRMFRQGEAIPILLDAKDAPSSSVSSTATPIMHVSGCCVSKSIGAIPQMSTEQSIQILQDAKEGWDSGNGKWPQMSLSQRIAALESFTTELQKSRDEIIKVLMYEIAKNYNDAASEFDRTVDFIRQTIKTVQTSEDFKAAFRKVSTSNVFIRRNAFGIVLALGPYNYPLNETYATIIPALLMGNIVILKIPQVGGLAHLLTFDAFSKTLPKNTVHFISGSGRKTLPPLMESGDIDGLAFIGGTSAADKLIKQHPEPHRLKVFLQLEAKNMAIVMKDMVEVEGDGDDGQMKQMAYSTSQMLDEIITGALSYNGQRCTALKLIFVPKGYGAFVAKELSDRVDALIKGMPWEVDGQGKYAQITPLPNKDRVEFMQGLIKDALSKGGVISNVDGGEIVEGTNYQEPYDPSTLMIPAVISNVTPEMRIYTEEQFGPIIPIVEYDDIEQVLSYGLHGKYAQQVSIFTNKSSPDTVSLVDAFSAVFGKININSQCGRSPDSVPFTARRSSGLGVMSIEDALKEFSVPTVVSYKNEGSEAMVQTLQKESNFMQPV
jgi:NAD-dependent aldehyde dehydrogenases